MLSQQLTEIMDIFIIGSKNKELLQRYENDQDAYEICDVTIEMHDSCFWEVFSKDEFLINRLAAKFKDTKFFESDFKKWL